MNRTDSKENRDNPETDKNFRRILHIIFQDVRKDNYTQKTRQNGWLFLKNQRTKGNEFMKIKNMPAKTNQKN